MTLLKDSQPKDTITYYLSKYIYDSNFEVYQQIYDYDEFDQKFFGN